MEKTEKKQFKELSEEQLKEVTGGRLLIDVNVSSTNCN